MKVFIKKSKLKSLINECVNEIASSMKIDKPHSSIYECVNRANSWSEGMKLNSFPIIEYRSDREIIGEGIQFEPEADQRGGIIAFSTDVNAIQLSPNKIVNWIKQEIATLENRLTTTKKVDRISVDHDLIRWTIGHYLDGRYTAKNGKQYGENSLSLEVVGVDFEKLVRIGEDLCKSFHQESVLVKDYSSGRVLFVDPS